MGNLKVVCLISGGKDSLFSILHCLENGHEVVALANLHPQTEDIEDVDSYMYQTIGHAIIPLYANALGLPLYRQEISGSAVNQNKSYGPNDQVEDETEALVPLLRKVQQQHPEINAISTGAILSDYQRTRVESVAIRLGLVPLSYLWQYPYLRPHTQKSLLEHMAAVGQDSRIVKVASGGLDESFLWQNVADPRTINRLEKAARRFGASDDGAVLGEGGEYETLAVAGPPPLWKTRIEVTEDERKIVAGEAGSVSLQIAKTDLITLKNGTEDSHQVHIPALLEPQFRTILDDLVSNVDDFSTVDEATESQFSIVADDTECHSAVVKHELLTELLGDGPSAAEQMKSIMDHIAKALRESEGCFADIAYTSIILRDMADFAAINSVYGSYFLHPNPAARITLACADVLPGNKHVLVSVTMTKRSIPGSVKGLHVQSRSYWAPANIGPYSQAISVPVHDTDRFEDANLVYIAGQIPLEPASMELATSIPGSLANEFLIQTVLAFQHFIRIGRVMQVKQWACGLAFVTADSTEVAAQRSKLVRRTWEILHRRVSPNNDGTEPEASEAEDFDVWDIQYGTARTYSHGFNAWEDVADGESTRLMTPPLYIARVDALPRGTSIEWVTYGLTAESRQVYDVPHLKHLLQLFKHKLI